ncbi:hypothetical protein ACLIBG_10855 [Virgibacillus sp. W0181]|uniref:hypothetical protein n=1 Tax=Virgibacillus sp. W0181 TaxID=3391581 RepID=UPI003F44A5F7
MYQLKEKILKNNGREKKVLVIQFDKQEMDIVGEFLMTDASLLHYQVLDELASVLAGEKKNAYFVGNRCSLIIRKEKTRVEDLLEEMGSDVDSLSPVEMNTLKLKNLIEMWRREIKEYDKQ